MKDIQGPIDLVEEKKGVFNLESILRKDFKLGFKGIFRNGNRWGYKVQVPHTVNKVHLVRVLDDFKERGERLLDQMGETREEIIYKDELRIKVEAAKYFIENHDRDSSLFVIPQVAPPKPKKPEAETEEAEAPTEPAYCSNLAGIYWEVGKEYKGERIEIIKVDCSNFKLKLNNENHKYNIPFSKNFKCNSIGSYGLCTKGLKIDNNLINVFINEKWHHNGCHLNKNITIDMGRGILNSGVTYRCNDRTKNFSKLIEYQLTPE